MSEVGFFTSLPFHEHILEPVRSVVSRSLPTFITSDRRGVVRRQPSVVVMADESCLEFFRLKLPRAMLGSVRHGLIWKRSLELRSPRPSARRFDFIAVGDSLDIDRYRALGAEPQETWRTGYPQLDGLFRRDPPPGLGMPAGRPTVLYAPTWNPGIGSASALGERVVDWIRGPNRELNVIIKPHPGLERSRPDLLAAWRRATAGDAGALLVEDVHEDVTRYMLAADLLVSDASSAIFLFLALDRPLVLFTNEAATRDPAYVPTDIAWQWRDIGAEVTRPEDVAAAVAGELAHPLARAATRGRRADELFGRFRDGQSHQRIAENIIDLAGRAAAGEVNPLPGPQPTALRHVLNARASLVSQPLVRRALRPAYTFVRDRRPAPVFGVSPWHARETSSAE